MAVHNTTCERVIPVDRLGQIFVINVVKMFLDILLSLFVAGLL